MKNKSKKSYFSTVLMLLIVTAILVITMLTTSEDPSQIWDAVRSANPWWLLLALACYVVFWLCDGVAIHFLIKKLANRNYQLLESIKTAIVGVLFSSLTPSATGGQPVQILRMKRNGIRVGNSTAIMVLRFIMFQSAAVFLGLILMLWKYDYFRHTVSDFRKVVILGLLVNTITALILLIVSLYPKLAQKSVSGIIKVFAKLRLVRDKDKTLRGAKETIEEFSQWPKLVKGDRHLLGQQFAITLMQMAFYFSIAFCIFRALGAEQVDFFLVMTASACVWLASSFVPLPGGSGGVEVMFMLFFTAVYKNTAVNAGLLLWRFVSFYFPIIAGGLVLLFENRRHKKMTVWQRLRERVKISTGW